MAEGTAEAVVREIRVRARPETVFAYFTDPAKMMEWKGIEAELDPKPGGIYRVNVTGRDIARGEYVEVVPPSRVVFTWGWEAQDSPVPPGSSTVEVTLVPDGDVTIVRLRHYNLPSTEARDQHAHGWEHYLARLELAGSGQDPGKDPWVGQEDPHTT